MTSELPYQPEEVKTSPEAPESLGEKMTKLTVEDFLKAKKALEKASIPEPYCFYRR